VCVFWPEPFGHLTSDHRVTSRRTLKTPYLARHAPSDLRILSFQSIAKKIHPPSKKKKKNMSDQELVKLLVW
jgi:hypothetical protein